MCCVPSIGIVGHVCFVICLCTLKIMFVANGTIPGLWDKRVCYRASLDPVERFLCIMQ